MQYLTDLGGCYSSPCFNGGNCSPLSNLGYTCSCTSSFYFKFLIIVMDLEINDFTKRWIFWISMSNSKH